MYGFSFNNIFLGQIILTETGLQNTKTKTKQKKRMQNLDRCCHSLKNHANGKNVVFLVIS